MSQRPYVTALDLALPAPEALPEDMRKYFAVCQDRLGMIPNVLRAYSCDVEQLRPFSRLYNALMFGESGLTALEREMIAVVVSSANHCFYCLTAHGANVREYAGDPVLGELMVMNYRAADLSARHRAMLDFAARLTETPDRIEAADRQHLRDVGFRDKDIWDIANVAGFYNMTNRVAAATDMQPNADYHGAHRTPR
ncbi:MAG: peroxidase-related enzyme [Gammaproteobacteria bacterium]|nr:peroxidase-related enzyme [Gammaproteobacteria bacterium]